MLDTDNPFHTGELTAQARAGKSDVPDWAAGFIRPFMPEQHRDFFTQLPFLVLAGADGQGRHWVTLVDGPDGFIASPDATTLTLSRAADVQDPLSDMFTRGGDVGLLGIELATRRRNRMSGHMRRSGAGFVIDVRQSFGNCPQYIHERSWRRAPAGDAQPARFSDALSGEQIARIAAADTLFIGTGHRGAQDHASNGYDASHRGGEPGFVRVVGPNRLRIPDYAGNNFFNTIGNLLENPAIGLVFVDFETGGLLHLTGQATVDWDAQDSHDPAAMRMIDVIVDAVVDRPAALSLRWSSDDAELQELVVTDKVAEAEGITSFHLSAVDGSPLPPFEAGQHLPVELDIPGQTGPTRRSYSLSGAPTGGTYRLTVKREAHGLASRHLHDAVHVGDSIRARRPSGDFVIPCSDCPLVLVSAGVGVTPVLSMLHAVAAQPRTQPVWFVHGARDGAHHALGAEVASLVARRANISHHVLYSRPRAEDDQATGRVTAQSLLALNAGPDAHYMLCGPAQFLADIRSGLVAAGVPDPHIHFETFGPAG